MKSAGSAGTLAATALLAIYCAPVLAASGIDCDRATARPNTLGITGPGLTDPGLKITVTDHAVTSSASDDAAGLEASETSRAITPAVAPQADTILRRIFDESYSSAELDELEPASATDAKSIAELALPPNSGKPSTDSDDGDLPALDADLPGISEDETLRYRRQMFRTDI